MSRAENLQVVANFPRQTIFGRNEGFCAWVPAVLPLGHSRCQLATFYSTSCHARAMVVCANTENRITSARRRFLRLAPSFQAPSALFGICWPQGAERQPGNFVFCRRTRGGGWAIDYGSGCVGCLGRDIRIRGRDGWVGVSWEAQEVLVTKAAPTRDALLCSCGVGRESCGAAQ